MNFHMIRSTAAFKSRALCHDIGYRIYENMLIDLLGRK